MRFFRLESSDKATDYPTRPPWAGADTAQAWCRGTAQRPPAPRAQRRGAPALSGAEGNGKGSAARPAPAVTVGDYRPVSGDDVESGDEGIISPSIWSAAD